MERSELIAKLCKEAAETTPDIYKRIVKAAKSEGLIKANGAGAPSSGGGRSSVNGAGGSAAKAVSGAAVRYRVAAVLAAIAVVFAAATAVIVPLSLNVKDGLNGGPQIEAPDGNGGNGGNGNGSGSGSGDNSGGQTPVNPKPEEPADPDGVKSIAIRHAYGDGKYLWNEKDVLAGKYNLFGAQLEVTKNDGTVDSKPLTYELLGDIDFSVGNHDITVAYEGKTAELSVFVAPDDGYIEAVSGNYSLKGSLDTLIFDLNSSDEPDFGGLSIEGKFNLKHGEVIYSGYYGETPVNERFVRNLNKNTAGYQECELTAGNIGSNTETIAKINAMGYTEVKTERKVFLSDVFIVDTKTITDDGGAPVVCHLEVSPDKPYIDVQDIADRYDYYEPDYRADFIFRQGDFTEYNGGGNSFTVVNNIADFNFYSCKITGDTTLNSVLGTGERLINIKNEYNLQTFEVAYTVYDSNYTNIRFCRVQGDEVLSYELKDGVTLDTIKQDLLKRSLYVEYFEKVNGKYVEIVPVTDDMLDFSKVDVNSYNLQYGSINFKDKGVGVNIVKPYTVEGANVLYTLTNSSSVNLLLSDTTVNDLGQYKNDACKEIVLYDNGVAMLKHTGNGIGNVLTGYSLDGNKLTLLRHGIATSFLTVNLSGKTFDEINLDSVTAGMQYTRYTFTHNYSPAGTNNLGWSATFTAYSGSSGYEYSKYVNVHLTGWAASQNENDESYQIAGVEYVATWTYGWNNNKQAFVLRFADKDWWFEIGAEDGMGSYKLTFIKSVTAS